MTTYRLRIHLIGGQTIRLDCKGYDVIPSGADRDGNPTPMRFDYTPIDEDHNPLALLDFRAVTAIESEQIDD